MMSDSYFNQLFAEENVVSVLSGSVFNVMPLQLVMLEAGKK